MTLALMPFGRVQALPAVSFMPALSIAVLAALGLVTLVAVTAERLPTLIVGLDTSRMTTLTVPVALPVVLGALVLCHRRTRGRTGPERWAPVIILACLCDLALTYASGHRYSVGWYGGRSLTLVAASWFEPAWP